MIYVPIDIRSPIKTDTGIQAQFGLTSLVPDIIVELHEGKLYYDIQDDAVITGTVTNTDLETTVFTGPVSIINPHRGQMLIQLVPNDFIMTGINTLTFKIMMGSKILSFQITVFIESISEGILKNI